MKTRNNDLIMKNKVFVWIALVTGFILMIPLIAMQFTSEVDWGLFDFIVIGALISGMGFLFVHVARVTPSKYKALTGLAFLAALILAWAHLAVGIIDNAPFAGS